MYRVVINFQGTDFTSKKVYPLDLAEIEVERFLDSLNPEFQSDYYVTIEMLEFGKWVTYSIHEWKDK